MTGAPPPPPAPPIRRGEPRRLSVLGATGSVGTQTLDLVAAAAPDAFTIVALTAHRDAVRLAALARRHRAEIAVVADEAALPALRQALAGTGIAAAGGSAALVEAASRSTDLVMAAIVGIAGLAPMVAAARTGATIALANKEGLVCAGPLLKDLVARHGGRLLPVDSEHNALFQCWEAPNRDAIEKVTLTASGGPFRTRPRASLDAVTAAQAVRHPVWAMGAKISVDSATLVNKALEVIEACLLFDLPEHQVDVLIHPQSIVHGLVHYADGSVLAQMGSPDMAVPIASALAWPERLVTPARRLELGGATLEFATPDPERWPALAVAREAIRRGGTWPALISAANEALVGSFLEGHLKFLAIDETLAKVLDLGMAGPLTDLDAVAAADQAGRRLARQIAGLRG